MDLIHYKALRETYEESISYGGKKGIRMSNNDWYNCEHEWTASGDEDLGDVPGMGPRASVVCIKCGCPGEMYEETGQVDWPTT